MLDFDVVVVGCGVAGIAASIYLKRANLNVCIIEKNAPGGQLNMITEIKNYPGFKNIDGPSLAFEMYSQIRELDVPYKYENVLEIKCEDSKKVVRTNKGEITCKYVVIANGRRPRELGVPDEKRYLGRGVSYCSICDGTLYKDKNVCVVGGGSSALESALYLSDIASKVYLVHRRDEFRGDESLVERVNKKDNIEVLFNKKVTKINDENGKIKSLILDDDSIVDVCGLFVNVGNIPIPIKCEGLNREYDYIIVDNNMKTSVDGIYACGDIIKKSVYQISTAVGEGTIAAMSIINDIKE